MIDLPKHKMTADEFLAWIEDLLPEAGRFELWDGEVVVQGRPGRLRGALAALGGVKFAICLALHDAIKRAGLPCSVAADGPMVRLAPNKLARPDALVYCGPGAARRAGGPQPADPSSRCCRRPPNRGTWASSRRGYFTLPSLHHYLIVDPDRARMIHLERGAENGIDPYIVTGPRLRLDPPGLDVDLTEVLGI